MNGPSATAAPIPGSAGVYLPAADNKTVIRPQWAGGPRLFQRAGRPRSQGRFAQAFHGQGTCPRCQRSYPRDFGPNASATTVASTRTSMAMNAAA